MMIKHFQLCYKWSKHKRERQPLSTVYNRCTDCLPSIQFLDIIIFCNIAKLSIHLFFNRDILQQHSNVFTKRYNNNQIINVGSNVYSDYFL